jgi:hypothetical protein
MRKIVSLNSNVTQLSSAPDNINGALLDIWISAFSPQHQRVLKEDPVLNAAFTLAMEGFDSRFIKTAVNCLLVNEAAMFLISVMAVGIQPETKNALFAPLTTPLENVEEASHNKIFTPEAVSQKFSITPRMAMCLINALTVRELAIVLLSQTLSSSGVGIQTTQVLFHYVNMSATG